MVRPEPRPERRWLPPSRASIRLTCLHRTLSSRPIWPGMAEALSPHA